MLFRGSCCGFEIRNVSMDVWLFLEVGGHWGFVVVFRGLPLGLGEAHFSIKAMCCAGVCLRVAVFSGSGDVALFSVIALTSLMLANANVSAIAPTCGDSHLLASELFAMLDVL